MGRALAFLLELRLEEGPLPEDEARKRLAVCGGRSRPEAGRTLRVLRPDRATLAFCEGLDHVVGHVIVELHRRRLHEVGGRPEQGATDSPIEGELGAPDRVDDHAGGVGRVPHLELELQVEGTSPKLRPSIRT